jgi:hypothetical protein
LNPQVLCNTSQGIPNKASFSSAALTRCNRNMLR